MNFVNDTNERNYPAVLKEIETAGFPVSNKLSVMCALQAMQQILDEACWFNATECDVLVVKNRIIELIHKSGLEYDEEIKEIYMNINEPQTNTSFRLYMHDIKKYEMQHGSIGHSFSYDLDGGTSDGGGTPEGVYNPGDKITVIDGAHKDNTVLVHFISNALSNPVQPKDTFYMPNSNIVLKAIWDEDRIYYGVSPTVDIKDIELGKSTTELVFETDAITEVCNYIAFSENYSVVNIRNASFAGDFWYNPITEDDIYKTKTQIVIANRIYNLWVMKTIVPIVSPALVTLKRK